MATANHTRKIGYSEFFALDFRQLPSEVLKTVKLRISQELHRRKPQEDNDLRLVHGAFVGIPVSFKQGAILASSYLKLLLDQDWSHLFTGGDSTPKYYVYAHVKPGRSVLNLSKSGLSLKFHGAPFYIGKGCGARAHDLKRNQGHGATLKELLLDGEKEDQIVHFVRKELTEDQALELESKLIYFFGTKYEQGRVGLLVNLDVPPRPNMLPWKSWVAANKEAMEKSANLHANSDGIRAIQNLQ